LQWADIVLLVVDAKASAQELKAMQDSLQGSSVPVWLVANKMDTVVSWESCWDSALRISALSGKGIPELRRALVDFVCSLRTSYSEVSLMVTNERQKDCIVRAQVAVENALAVLGILPLECVSAEVRVALNALQEIVGQTSTEDILGRIFSKFCIGK
jgi:tRNA modification GTPase